MNIRLRILSILITAGIINLHAREVGIIDPVKLKNGFVYDSADLNTTSVPLSGGEAYEPHLFCKGPVTYIVWLEFVSGQGDKLKLSAMKKSESV